MTKKEIYEDALWHLNHADKYTIELDCSKEEKLMIKGEIKRSKLTGEHISRAVERRIDNLCKTKDKCFSPFKISAFIQYISDYELESLETYFVREDKKRKLKKEREKEAQRIKALPDYYTEDEAEEIHSLMMDMIKRSSVLCEDKDEDILAAILGSKISMERFFYGLSARLKKEDMLEIKLVKYLQYLGKKKTELVPLEDKGEILKLVEIKREH